MSAAALAGSNSLPDLAARIRQEHHAVDTALKESLRHAIAAGELLLEAKAQVSHGHWLPWLGEHCQISERTAQLYMRCAKNRPELENQIRNDIADLTLSEAAALLALSSDVRRLLRFTADLENLDDVDQVIQAAIEANIPVIVDKNYDPLHGRADTERLEWHVFALFLTAKGYRPEGASAHIEWILQRPFQNVAEWLGEEGDKFRRVCGMAAVPPKTKQDWEAFLSIHSGKSIADIEGELTELVVQADRQPKRRKAMRAGGAA